MQQRPKAILCLCHDSNVLQVRCLLLERFGYMVLPTRSVEDAKEMAIRRCPDMFLMDSNHPGVDFEELATKVKEGCPNMLTVVLSPYYYGGRSGSNGTVDRFVANDNGPQVLIAQIQELFDERQHGEDDRVERRSV